MKYIIKQCIYCLAWIVPWDKINSTKQNKNERSKERKERMETTKEKGEGKKILEHSLKPKLKYKI